MINLIRANDVIINNCPFMSYTVKQGEFFVVGELSASDYWLSDTVLDILRQSTDITIIDFKQGKKFTIDLIELYEKLRFEIDNTEMYYDWFVSGDFRLASSTLLYSLTCYNKVNCLPYEMVHQVIEPIMVSLLATDWLAGDSIV